MDPLQWLQDNIFYTDAKTKEINDAMYKNAPPVSAADKKRTAVRDSSRSGLDIVSEQSQRFADTFKPENVPVSPGFRAAVQEQKAAVKEGTGLLSRSPRPEFTGEVNASPTPASTPEPDLTGAPPAPILPPPPTSAAVPSGRDTAAPVDPNNTGAKGTSMSFSNVITGIDEQYGGKTRNAFEAENLPGTAGYPSSFALNSGKNQSSFGESMTAGKESGLNISSPAMRSAAGMGYLSAEGENQRQLTPGEGSFAANPQKLGVMDTSIPKSEGSDNSRESARLRARAAFLDPTKDSYQGLRAAELEMGLGVRHGRYFAHNPNAEGGETEISRKAYQARMGGGGMADAINNNAIVDAKGKGQARLTQSGALEQTAATEAPSDVENPFVIGEDGKTETIDNTSALHGARNSFNTNVKMPNWFGKDLNTDRQMFGL